MKCSTNGILPAERDDLIRMIEQLGAALDVQISEKDAKDMLCDAAVSIGIKMLIPIPGAVVLPPDSLRKVRTEVVAWQIVLSLIKRIEKKA